MTALDDPVGVGPDADAAESVRTSGSGRAEEELRRYRRSPRDLLRLVSYAVTTLLVVGLTIWAEDSVLGLEEDILALFDFLAPAIERVLHGSLEWIGFTIFVGIYLVPLVTKRYRLFLYLLTAGTVSFGLMQLTLWALQREEPRTLVNEIARRAGIEASTTSGAIGFAGYAASFVVLGPFVSSMWRRAGVIALGGLVLVRFLVVVRPAGRLPRRHPARCGGRRRGAVAVRPSRPPADDERHPAGADRHRPGSHRGASGAGRRTRLDALLRHPGRRHRACSSRSWGRRSGPPT